MMQKGNKWQVGAFRGETLRQVIEWIVQQNTQNRSDYWFICHNADLIYLLIMGIEYG